MESGKGSGTESGKGSGKGSGTESERESGRESERESKTESEKESERESCNATKESSSALAACHPEGELRLSLSFTRGASSVNVRTLLALSSTDK